MALMIPILALSIPVVAIIFSSLVKMARLKAEAQHGALPIPELDSRMAALEEEVVSLRHELIETQERLDFTERLLASKSQVDSAERKG
ncbi:MAG: hypothetical protein R2909_09450 [Gemmatimonadales bacterium]